MILVLKFLVPTKPDGKLQIKRIHAASGKECSIFSPQNEAYVIHSHEQFTEKCGPGKRIIKNTNGQISSVAKCMLWNAVLTYRDIFIQNLQTFKKLF